MKKVFAVILLAASAQQAIAQTNNTSVSKGFPLAGTWTLKAAQVMLPDGTHATDTALGSDAKGILMIDTDGQYSLQIFKSTRPKFASGDKRRGTAQEYESALSGMSTHIGHIIMDTVNRTLQFNIDYAAFPNWDHTIQTRQFRLTGDELYYRLPPKAGSGTVAVSVWQRIKLK